MDVILGKHDLDFVSRSEAQTRRLGARLAELLRPGDVICLVGELGTGKTCFAQGVGCGLGAKEPITSPTFTLINEYRGAGMRLPFYHIDLYRIESAKDLLSLGLEDYFYGEGVCVIEWADRARGALPQEHLWVRLRHVDETKRAILMRGVGKRYQELLREFRKRTFGI